MKIGKHYEIQKVTKEDFSLLSENMDIKGSVILRIFDEFESKSHKAFEALRTEEKISKEILDLIAESMEVRFHP